MQRQKREERAAVAPNLRALQAGIRRKDRNRRPPSEWLARGPLGARWTLRFPEEKDLAPEVWGLYLGDAAPRACRATP
ncbi:hypothetical protein D9M70_177190 [compost metagenome]